MRHPARGFTIVELLIVMVIMGMMVAFAAPRIDGTRFRMNAAMQVLGTTMLTIQRQAITQQHNIIVRIDTAGRRLRIHEDRNNNEAVDTGEHERAVPIGEGVVFGRGGAPAMGMGAGPVAITRVVSSMPAWIFHRDGSASEAGGFYITSQRAQNEGSRPADARAVTMSRATGRAAWFRYRADGWVKAF